MEKRNTAIWFQVLAICSALGLGGAYVWNRQKQAAPPPKPAPVPTVILETENEDLTPAAVKVDDKEMERILLSGSKSGILSPPLTEKKEEPEEDKPKEPRVLMPSSKSAAISPPNDKPVTQKQRTLLPGSKSIDGILKPPPQTPPKQNNEKP